MTITGQSALSKEEIDRMVRDAESHAAEDRRRKEEADVRNNADTLVYQTEKLLHEQGEKITGDEKDKVESALSELKEALSGTEVDSIRQRTEVLLTASQGFTQRLYEQASASEGAASGEGPASSQHDDEIVDAEIVDEEGRSA